MILHNIACRKYGFALQPPVCVLRERRKGLTAICAAPCTRLIRSRSFNLHIMTGNFMTEYSSKKHETGGMKKILFGTVFVPKTDLSASVLASVKNISSRTVDRIEQWRKENSPIRPFSTRKWGLRKEVILLTEMILVTGADVICLQRLKISFCKLIHRKETATG